MSSWVAGPLRHPPPLHPTHPAPARAMAKELHTMSDNVRILPMTDHIGEMVIHHGERGSDIDPVHPLACLCGEPYYLHCPHFGDWLEGLTLYPGPAITEEPS